MEIQIGTNFYRIGRSGERRNRCHKKQNSRHSKVSLRNFLNFFKDQIASKSKDVFLKFPKILETCKKKVLKEIALFFLEKFVELNCNGQLNQVCSFLIDVIDKAF